MLWGGSDTFWPEPCLTTTYNLLQSLPSPVQWVAQSWPGETWHIQKLSVQPFYKTNLCVSRTVPASFMDTPNLIILSPTIQLDRQLISPSPQHQGCIPLFADLHINNDLVKWLEPVTSKWCDLGLQYKMKVDKSEWEWDIIGWGRDNWWNFPGRKRVDKM